MSRMGTLLRWHTGVISRSGLFRRRFCDYGISSDRLGMTIPGRQARHDGVAMCLLRKDMPRATMPMRRAQRIARNRRILGLLWVFVLLWWSLGWFLL